MDSFVRYFAIWVLLLSCMVFASDDFLISEDYFLYTVYEGGASPGPGVVTMTNLGDEALNWLVVGDSNELPASFPDWLSVSPLEGTIDPNGWPSNQQDIVLSYDTAGLSAGLHESLFKIQVSEPVDSMEEIRVRMIVKGPALSVDDTDLQYQADENGANPVGQTIEILNSGGGILDWNIDCSGCPGWLSISPMSGSVAREQFDTVTVSVDITDLAAGEYSCSFVIDGGAGSDDSPQTVDVSLFVNFEKYDWSENIGDGSEANPYQISTTQQLMSIGDEEALLDKHFILMNDIVFDPDNNPWHVFDRSLIAPYVNRDSVPFTGVFDGGGYAIRNLKIDVAEDSSSVGLFRTVEEGGVVTNLRLDNFCIYNETIYNHHGGIAGRNTGEITHCAVSGIISVNGRGPNGGIVGINSSGGLITDCHVDVVIWCNNGYGGDSGGLAGRNWEGTILRCHVSGEVEGSSGVGGLVGYDHDGVIEDCYCDVSVKASEGNAGGLVGSGGGSHISRCSARGDVIGGKYLGGFGGYFTDCVVEDCWSTGSVQGGRRLGGFVGLNVYGLISGCLATGSVAMGGDDMYDRRNYGGFAGSCVGDIIQCYATGSVEGYEMVGGFAGIAPSGSISHCYSLGTVIGSEDVGGFVSGYVEPNSITDCYFLDTSGPDNGHGIALTDAMMKDSDSFVGWDFDPNDGDPAEWKMPVDGYPALAWETFAGILPDFVGLNETQATEQLDALGISWEIERVFDAGADKRVLGQFPCRGTYLSRTRTVTLTVSSYIRGEGSLADPYQIETIEQLKTIQVGKNLQDKHYILTRDIIFDPGDESHVFNSAIFGTVFYFRYDSVQGIIGETFSGTFDGQGHRIVNLRIFGTGYASLFGYIEAADPAIPSVRNLIVEDPVIKGQGLIGGLAGCVDNSRVENCGVRSGFVSGGSSIGGMFGEINGRVSNCYSTASVNGTGYYSGGLIGVSYSSTLLVENCYAAGPVTGERYSQEFIGDHKGTLDSCYFLDRDGGGWNHPVVPLSEEAMKQQSSFDGWDFVGEDINGSNNIWRMCVDGIAYPRLSMEFARQGDFACGDGVDMADFAALAEAWLSVDAADPAAFDYSCDGNRDGVIDLEDFAILSERWQ